MKKSYITAVLFSWIVTPLAWSDPMAPTATVNIEGTIQKVTWQEKRQLKDIPEISGSAGEGRFRQAHYQLVLVDTKITSDGNGRTPFTSGQPAHITINQPKNERYLIKEMKIRITGYTMSSDEGGVRSNFKEIEVLGMDYSERTKKAKESIRKSFNKWQGMNTGNYSYRVDWCSMAHLEKDAYSVIVVKDNKVVERQLHNYTIKRNKETDEEVQIVDSVDIEKGVELGKKYGTKAAPVLTLDQWYKQALDKKYIFQFRIRDDGLLAYAIHSDISCPSFWAINSVEVN
jgi:hypothetical protein